MRDGGRPWRVGKRGALGSVGVAGAGGRLWSALGALASGCLGGWCGWLRVLVPPWGGAGGRGPAQASSAAPACDAIPFPLLRSWNELSLPPHPHLRAPHRDLEHKKQQQQQQQFGTAPVATASQPTAPAPAPAAPAPAPPTAHAHHDPPHDSDHEGLWALCSHWESLDARRRGMYAQLAVVTWWVGRGGGGGGRGQGARGGRREEARGGIYHGVFITRASTHIRVAASRCRQCLPACFLPSPVLCGSVVRRQYMFGTPDGPLPPADGDEAVAAASSSSTGAAAGAATAAWPGFKEVAQLLARLAVNCHT